MKNRSWKNSKVENHRLKRPVAEAREVLDVLTDEDITVLWRELRKLLSNWVNTRLDDPRKIPPQMETHAFQGEFLPLHSKYTDHELFIGALINEYSPLIEFGKKHTYQKVLSICILKEAFYGDADAAFSARDNMKGADKEKLSKLFSEGGKKSSSLDEGKLKRVYDVADTLRSEGYKDDCVHKGYAPEIERRLKEAWGLSTDKFKEQNPVPSLNTIKDYLHVWNEVNNFYLGELPPLISMTEATKNSWVDKYKK